MRKILFYSWQSDLPNSTNRGFIQQALEKAVVSIANDNSLGVEPVIDRDTKGMSGSPDISQAIFAKISAADIFVADISVVIRPRKGRSSPNPNVLIELGYALRALGHERVILVFNTAFGKIEELPFDLRTRRVVPYYLPREGKGVAVTRKQLTAQLEAAILGALKHLSDLQDEGDVLPSLVAIEQVSPSRVLALRNDLHKLFANLKSVEPLKYSAGGIASDLLSALDQTQETVADFSKIAERISVMNDAGMAAEVYRWFGRIFEQYDFPKGFNGAFSIADHDFYKFIGHELFVTLFALLIRENKWDIISTLLAEPIRMGYVPEGNGPGSVDWEYASMHLTSLAEEGKKKNRTSLHADLLKTRHVEGGLAAVMPFDEFMSADFFLYLFGVLPTNDVSSISVRWRPWSILYLEHTPMFITDAKQPRIASQLASVFQLSNANDFKKRLEERGPLINKFFGFMSGWRYPVRADDVANIGTQGSSIPMVG